MFKSFSLLYQANLSYPNMWLVKIEDDDFIEEFYWHGGYTLSLIIDTYEKRNDPNIVKNIVLFILSDKNIDASFLIKQILTVDDRIKKYLPELKKYLLFS